MIFFNPILPIKIIYFEQIFLHNLETIMLVSMEISEFIFLCC